MIQVQACCLTGPSHYLKQCGLLISEVLRHWPEGNFTVSTQATILYDFEKHIFKKLTAPFPRCQGVYGCAPSPGTTPTTATPPPTPTPTPLRSISTMHISVVQEADTKGMQGSRNYITYILEDAIPCHCPWYLLLAQHFCYICRQTSNISHTSVGNEIKSKDIIWM